MKTRRITATVLSATLLASLAACGERGGADAPATAVPHGSRAMLPPGSSGLTLKPPAWMLDTASTTACGSGNTSCQESSCGSSWAGAVARGPAHVLLPRWW